MNQLELFQNLLEKYLTNCITPSETEELRRLLNDPSYQKQLELIMDREFASKKYSEEEFIEIRNLVFDKIEQQGIYKTAKVIGYPGWKKLAIAVSVVFLLGFISWIILESTNKIESVPIAKKQRDVTPGSFKAKLTLADGSSIILDSAVLGELARQDNTTIILEEEQLVYKADEGSISMVYNTVSTSRGETYSLILADGTTVYLNSASSVKFPVSFSGDERRIEITGESYLKVAKNAAQPFIVYVNGMAVKALGTEFNINAYPDESVTKTTLIEGLVEVSIKDNPLTEIIKPGQQTTYKGNALTVVNDVNIDDVIAWKDGFFHFENADLQSILRQLSRWYDVEVQNEGVISEERYFMIMSRKSSLSSVLKALQANDINFSIEENRLIVKPR
jgi:ferric-dicitrate binding protein FerR (iron transport regulator)